MEAISHLDRDVKLLGSIGGRWGVGERILTEVNSRENWSR